MSPARRRQMVDRGHPKLPIVRQRSLLGVTCQGRRHVDGRHSLRVGTIIAIALSIVSTRGNGGCLYSSLDESIETSRHLSNLALFAPW